MPVGGAKISREQGEEAQERTLGNGSMSRSKHGKTGVKPRQDTSRKSADTEGAFEADKVSLVAERQAQLEAVADRHDTLVREMFHMEHFIMMLGYDPKDAKKDDTKVFQDYKAMYDLVDKAIPGPSRPTRRRRTEQRQFLKTPSISAPTPSTPLTKGKAKLGTTPATVRETAGVSSRSKGKSRETIMDLQLKENGGTFTSENGQQGYAAEESISGVLSQRSLRKKDRITAEASPVLEDHKETNRRAFASNGHIREPGPTTNWRSGRLRGSIVEPELPLPQTTISISHPASQVGTPLAAGSSTSLNIPLSSVVPKFNIKRVKLLVRRPPPPLTNPRQRPPPAKHNSSLKTFLSSYTTLYGHDVDEKALQRRAEADALILERIELFQKQGRLVPGADLLFDINTEVESSSAPQRVTKDHWDNIVEAAIHYRKSRSKYASGPQIAVQIAAKIRAYWDGQEARKDKLKLQEERKLRMLAKATIRMVTNEWKKAVFYIREQNRLKLEAEEVRRGHEHLDAILDQSGQLLETQQGNLTRHDHSHSRSSSMSLAIQGWETESGDEDDEETGEDDDDDEDEDEGLEGQEMNEEDGGIEREGNQLEIDESESCVDTSSNADDEGETRMLIDSPNLSHTPVSIHSSLVEAADFIHDRLSMEKTTSDEEPEPDGSSIFAVDELVSIQFDRSQHTQHISNVRPHVVYGIEPPTQPITPESGNHLELEKSQLLSDPQSPPTDPTDISDLEQSLELNHDTLKLSSPTIPTHVIRHSSIYSPPYSARCSSHDSTGHRPQEVDSPVRDSTQRDNIQTDITSNVESNPPLNDSCSRTDDDINAHGDQNVIVHVMDETCEVDGSNIYEPLVEPEPAQDEIVDTVIPDYLKPFAVVPVDWNPDAKIVPPLLLRGILRPYQQSGLEWLASLHTNNLNGILADEMGLGKTIQTIALLAHLACDRGIWGPHLIVVPTSVLLNWEMEFKKFLPGFKILGYHGSTKRRKELRQGWNDKHHFNVCITSYTLASRDAHIFKRKAWYYMILDEAHMIKNFKSQRWNILLMFRSFRRLLLTGTPLQNNLTELWALLQFLMSGANFANLKEFGEWFSNPLEKAIEMGSVLDDETLQRVSKLHTVLRPYLLRRLKKDVEKELPSKYEHLVMCPLSKRQRFLYDEFMSRAHTRDALQSGIYQKIANILMQLRKVCNHPDLFEVRPIVTSFAMEKSAVADFEIRELLLRRRLINDDRECVNLGLLGLQFIDKQNTSLVTALESRRLEATSLLPFISETPGEPPPKDTRTISGFRKYSAYLQRANTIAHWSHVGYLNRLRCGANPIYCSEMLDLTSHFYQPIIPASVLNVNHRSWDAVRVANFMVKSFETRAEEMASLIDRFAFVTPLIVALDMPRIALSGFEATLKRQPLHFDNVLHRASVKLQIAFPDPSLLQYDCGKLQELAHLLREKKAGGHRVLIFTQMTRILDILEVFLNFHGYLYLRLDGATKIEDRQYITERFNADSRILCFIASSRSGGVGINLTGADTVVFYDSDFNPQMDKQCEDRAHRIGQIRDVHIYRFVSRHTVEEALLRKANQKRSLDDLVIQKGEFDWRSLFNDESAFSKALEEFEDTEDAHAAAVAAREEVVMEGADEADFDGDLGENPIFVVGPEPTKRGSTPTAPGEDSLKEELEPADDPDDPDEGGSVAEYMIATVQRDYEYFRDWRL